MADLLSMTDKKNADKQKALESALSQIERQFGKGSIMKLGSENAIQEIEATSTGSLGWTNVTKGSVLDIRNSSGRIQEFIG